ncbi:hypothetical protein SteCoe_35410 [Stentor coeruleus]|uniref:Uncharacterized protein n=1 Tax=Stentor coeruleus TaxID=5963 RepID=A0A1R2ASD2_9CILI|nr:hypothetical protein SteCoe_35410 [Stentor coeruleus]
MFYILLNIVSALEFTEVKIAGSKDSFTLDPGCQVFHLGTNFQRTEMHFWPEIESKINWIHYSDVLYDKCDNKCLSNAVLCGEISESSTSEVIIGACVSDIYIYVKAASKVTLTITSSYIQGKCDPIPENLYTKCGSLNYEECDKCGDDCRLAGCIKEKKNNQEEKIIMNLCLPYDSSDYEINIRCKGHVYVDSGKWKQDCNNSLKIQSVGSATIAALVLIMIFFFGFFGLVTWYNWRMKNDGNPPFRCPRICPEVLFPRRVVRRMNNEDVIGYRPPEIPLQSIGK